jgi:ankyrin repeat protein
VLLEKGASLDKPAVKGNTPLHVASQWGRREVVEMLLAKGADINAKNEEGATPLGMAVLGRHEDLALFLREKGADVPDAGGVR